MRGLEYFESLQHLEGRKFSSLESASQLLSALGNPQNQIPAIHVAGTNAKGSVCAILSSILHSAGFQVGQTSSPHLVSVTERCLVNGVPISEVEFSETVEEVVEVAQSLNIAPSYFVLGIVTAFLCFTKKKLDWMLVEVGLGGLLDATNLIKSPKVCVITGISEDHVEILGPTIADIAANKAGISKQGVPLLVGQVCVEARLAIKEVAKQRGTIPEFMGIDFTYDERSDLLCVGDQKFQGLLSELPLKGRHQKFNAALAISVALRIGLTLDAIESGIRSVRWPGRLEHIRLDSNAPDILLDVAHNPQGIAALVDYVSSLSVKAIVLVISILDRKDWRNMLLNLRRLKETKKVFWIFTHSGHEGAVSPDMLKAENGEGIEEADSLKALTRALEIGSLEIRAGEGACVVVSGSVFLVGKIREVVCGGEFVSISREAIDSDSKQENN